MIIMIRTKLPERRALTVFQVHIRNSSESEKWMNGEVKSAKNKASNGATLK